MGAYIRTYSGGRFCPTEPLSEDLRIEDVAHHICRLGRYTGAAVGLYTIGQHCVYVSELVPRFCSCPEPDKHELCGLLHDGPEFCMNDLNRPVKHGDGMEFYRDMEDRVWRDAFAPKWRLPAVIPPCVKAADRFIAKVEMNCLNPNWPTPADLTDEMRAMRIEPWPIGWAEYAFLKRFKELELHEYRPTA